MILGLWLACASERPEVGLASMDAWRVGSVSRDPFPGHRMADDEDCPPGTVIVEGQTVEIDTGACRYVLLEQPLLADVRQGERVEVVFWHSDLAALEDGDAHVVFAVNGTVWLDRRVPIPAIASAYADIVEVPANAEAGDPLLLHLHNHGANTWNVLRLTRQSTSPPP